jgi:CheY-like chemotaxis protein
MANVLLVEPDRILAKNYLSALKSAGHDVVWRSSGQAAVHAADEVRPDVILLELQMPGHNGLEFLYELRSYPEWQDIAVILLTMVPDMALRSEEPILERLGVKGYLYKPQTKLRHVVLAVERALQTVS